MFAKDWAIFDCITFKVPDVTSYGQKQCGVVLRQQEVIQAQH
jgi:hypothetical protein